MTRDQLADEQWAFIDDIFPPHAKTRRKPRDRRVIVDATTVSLAPLQTVADGSRARAGP
ncbi:hypothetical protein CA54_40300 [Symmachiella macrocystis]|uniref:Transposase n=1 Tax=Symmachiella macrocystis TaxID=2527985 RepID=A0A5C6B9N1_9PLAN|nr:hypothetical protein CA54_40300 [Symmachiella macrocystis]